MNTSASTLHVTTSPWGETGNGQPVSLFSLSNEALRVHLTDYGARIVALEAPDRHGKMANVVLGYDTVAAYEGDTTFLGATVGRYANRIGKGTFTLDGETFHIPLNNNGNALHGGPQGFDRKVWSAREIPGGIDMSLMSPDGDMGFPGELNVQVRFILNGASLHITYVAATSRPTVVNLSNHAYFNLAGEGSGSVLEHVLTIPASYITPVDALLIPTGEIMPVQDTPFDFRTPTAIGSRIAVSSQQLSFAAGYDHNFVLDAPGPSMHLAAHVVDPGSGRALTVKTTEPGVQFYSGNYLARSFEGKYKKHDGFPLETQHFPDSPNHDNFPSTVVRPGAPFASESVFTLGVED